MVKLRIILLIATLWLTASGVQAQHTPLLSQYIFNGQIINPALAGKRDVLSISGSYRNQWTGFAGSPKTQLVSLETPVRKKNIGLGALIYNDQIGVRSELGIYTSYAYAMKLAKGRLALGLSGGISMLSARWENVLTTDPGDGQFMPMGKLHVLPNFGTGLTWDHRIFELGLSLPRLLTHSFDEVNSRYKLGADVANNNMLLKAGLRLKPGSSFEYMPSVLYRRTLLGTQQIDINQLAVIDNVLGIGLSYRHQESLVALVKLRISPQLFFGYSYDYLISNLANYSAGSHEIYLRYDFKYRTKTANPRFF